MKILNSTLIAALLALLCCAAAVVGAQEATSSEWVKVAPPDEAFTVLMPRVPFPLAESGKKAGALVVAGQRYNLRYDNAEYTIWSFQTKKLPAALSDDTESYLDQCAELAWDLMIEPYWEKFKRDSPEQLSKYNLTYDGALPSPGHPGRRYLLNLDEQHGITHVYAVGSRVYIVAASGAPHESAGVERFVKSFALSLQPVPNAPAAAAAVAVGAGVVGPGRGSNESVSGGAGGTAKEGAKETDYSRTFQAREVTRKAQILTKPEPSYTEPARKFSVIGAVRVRAVLMASGKVGGVTLISKLPHGLTREVVGAARKIKFEPAVKDGRPVSQYVQIEYNFNIY